MSRQSAPPTLLSLLPREIIQNILSLYCDCKSIALFWQAFSVSQIHSSGICDLLDNAVGDRFRNLDESIEDSKERILSCISPPGQVEPSELQTNPKVKVRRMQTRYLSQRLTALDYCEQIPNIIWCGLMEFKDPMLPDWSAQHAQVVLLPDDGGRYTNAWTIRNIHGWSSSFPIQIKLVSQNYNFIPIPPRGRIFGISNEDKETIRDIRRRLESRDQVMTLRYRNDDGFILRIVSPEQARQRLSSFFLHSDFETFPEGLLCSWEYPSGEDDYSPLAKEDLLKSVFHNLSNYKKAVAPSV